MAIDFSAITPPRKEKQPIDPIELFQKLKVSDPSINDLWLAQGDALRQWHTAREKRDTAIVLNTGAGKTFVGLLIAQSLVNETKGHVLYTCSSIQLVEQTAKKAEGYGLAVTKYYRGNFDNELYYQGRAPCITTYQALFNGRSIFFREELSAIVFDDAHAAEHLLRDHFSLQIEREVFPALYRSLTELFKDYHQKIGKLGSYTELINTQASGICMVPPFEIHHQYSELMRLLMDAQLGDQPSTTFSWAHLRDKIDLCAIFMSSTAITITPPFVPVRALRYFAGSTRRVYLSATLKAEDGFTRTFGAPPDEIIAPETTAGECERLIIVPSRTRIKKDEDVIIAKELVRSRKALILVPTYFRARTWADIASLPQRDSVAEDVERFKNATTARKMLLAARYDGVDLPGDTCRVMVIDGLPTGVGPLERFQWEYLNLSNSLRSTIASRIVQSFGRISRGMSDHGVVILTGQRLVDWLLIPKNLAMLPPFLQKQIELGMSLSSQAKNTDELIDAVGRCLGRDRHWTESYNNYMEASDTEHHKEDAAARNNIAKAEADFAVKFWDRDFAAAALRLSQIMEKTFDFSTPTAGWHCFWVGRCYEMLNDAPRAAEMYRRAHGIEKNIPPPILANPIQATDTTPEQVLAIERQLSVDANGKVHVPRSMHTDLAHLDGSGTVKQTEESLRALGQYLGLDSFRPDNEYGTGPDVFWRCPKLPALCMECKTDKESSSEYRKQDIGQLSDHVQWIRNNSDAKTVIPIFVGPIVRATERSNPPPEFRVMELEEFEKLSKILKSALTDVCTNAIPITLRQTILEVLKGRNLLWPSVFESLKSTQLKTL